MHSVNSNLILRLNIQKSELSMTQYEKGNIHSNIFHSLKKPHKTKVTTLPFGINDFL